jgi:hypothetical protein
MTGMAQNMRDGTVYGCSAPALLVVEATGVADTSEYQPMSNSIEMARRQSINAKME